MTVPGRELDPAGCPRLVDSGVFLLGAITSPERADYAAHLNGCTDCQREVDQLAHLPALLSRITPPPTGRGVTSPASATTTGRPTGSRTRSRPRTGLPGRPAPADTAGQSTRPGSGPV